MAVGNTQLDGVSTCVEIVPETVLETNDSGLIMLASPHIRSDSSANQTPQTAIVLAPVHDHTKNRICFEYSQPQTGQNFESSRGEILRVSLTGASTELRSNRSLEALCNAADSELKNIGHQIPGDEQAVLVKDEKHSDQVAHIMNSVAGSSGRLMLPAVHLEPDSMYDRHSEAVLLMPKPVAVSDCSRANAEFYMPLRSNSVSAGISISNSVVERASSVVLPKILPQGVQMIPGSVIQSRDSTLSVAKPRRHMCRFCGRVCAKPSVLQKHIRTHTNERPYPCTTCGLRFKTKSNLYKHRKSRAHSRTHLYHAGGISKSLSDDEAIGKMSANEETPNNMVETVTDRDDQREQSRTDETVDRLHLSPQLSPTFTENRIPGEVSRAACKLLTVIDGNMYMMEQVALQPVVQQGCSAPLQTSADVRSDKLADSLHSPLRRAVIPTARSDISAFDERPKGVEPSNQSVSTTEALQERISRLISENATIINTPMAEAPRAKRVLRQSSDVTASTATKLSASRPLLRTRSLTPCPTVLPVSVHNDADEVTNNIGMERTEDYRQNLLRRATSETTVYGSPRVSGPASVGMQFLTVPNEPHFIEGVPNRLMSLSSQVDDEVIATDIQCSEVRIVLELADSVTSTSAVISAEKGKEADVFHFPGVTTQPFSVVASGLSTGLRTSERRSSSQSSVTGLMPTFCMIKPVEQTPALPVHCIEANPVTSSVPVQCVLLGNSDLGIPVTSHTVSHSQNSAPLVVVGTRQPQRRGRPKGSKNRPKLAASNSEPKVGVMPPVAVREAPLSATAASTSTADSLWRLKLKDQLMRRSLSSEHRASPASKEEKPASSSCESASQSRNIADVVSCGVVTLTAARGGQLLSASSSLGSTPSATVATQPVIRSQSCDASVPPKKRRKTLTELGRGTAFGTRVEESTPSGETQSNKIIDASSLDVADDSVFESQSENPSVGGAVTDMANLFPHTNRALQVMYNSPPRASALCSTAVMHSTDTTPQSLEPESRVIRLPSGIGSKIPGLVRCSGSAPDSNPDITVLPTFRVHNTAVSSACISDDTTIIHDVARDQATGLARVVSTDHSRVGNCTIAISSEKTGHKVTSSSVASVDETELFELPSNMKSSSGTLLLLGHSFPSLGIVAEPTFCSILSTQPTCVEVTGELDGRASMYNSWRASDSTSVTDTELVLTARETFSLYRTSRLGKDLSYSSSPAFDSRSGGVLTHSSYWKYRTDHKEVDARQQSASKAASPVVDPDQIISASASVFDSSTLENGTTLNLLVSQPEDHVSLPSSDCTAASEVADDERKLESTVSDTLQKRVWIFPGGYRSSESYVYVRGRGRGRYVCASCGVRCKKPSVLRKHLRSHTDIRPHHCRTCDVGFKTKGNLSKHLNSKAHHSRSSELVSSSEQIELGKSVEGSSYDADVESSCEMTHGGSTVDPESDSGCELQQSSSCEVEPEAVSSQRRSFVGENDGEICNADLKLLAPAAETPRMITLSSPTHLDASYSRSLYVDVSGYHQPVVIAPAVQQRSALQSQLKLVVLFCSVHFVSNTITLPLSLQAA